LLAWERDERCLVTRRALRERLAAGWSMEQALTTPGKTVGSSNGSIGNSLTAFGETKSVTAWSRDPRCQISRTRLRQRLASGMAPEDALSGVATRHPDFANKTAFGESKSLVDWVRDSRCVVTYQTLILRLANGLGLEDALTAPTEQLRLDGAKRYVAFGEEKTLSQWVLDSRCPVDFPSTLHARIHKLNLSVEEAITTTVDHNSSLGEDSISKFISDLGFEIKRNDQSILGRQHLDIYVPDKRFAVEFNGVFWHSEKFRDRWYHHNKWKACQEKGIDLIQIWSDTWRLRPQLVLNMVQHKLGKSAQPRAHTRDTVVAWDTDGVENFLNQHHLQGAARNTHSVALFDSGQMIAVACFMRTGEHEWELNRYATDRRVPGGLSKILKAWKARYSERVKSFADLCISNGNIYERVGFRYDGVIPPDFTYLVGEMRQHKFGYRKKRFEKDASLLFDPLATEAELAAMNGLLRVWDAGKIRYVL
jgi:hypothetical protein